MKRNHGLRTNRAAAAADQDGQDGQDEELTVVSRLEKAESWTHDVMAVTGHVFTRLGLSLVYVVI